MFYHAIPFVEFSLLQSILLDESRSHLDVSGFYVVFSPHTDLTCVGALSQGLTVIIVSLSTRPIVQSMVLAAIYQAASGLNPQASIYEEFGGFPIALHKLHICETGVKQKSSQRRRYPLVELNVPCARFDVVF